MQKTKKPEKDQKVKNPNRLYRPEYNRVIGGVCAGLGIFLQIDPAIVRLILVLITIFGGSGVLLYLILWIIIPSESSNPELTKENINDNIMDIKNKAQQFSKEIKSNTSKWNTRQLFGIVILVFGILLLFGNFGFVSLSHLVKFIPAIIIIILGIAILKKGDF